MGLQQTWVKNTMIANLCVSVTITLAAGMKPEYFGSKHLDANNPRKLVTYFCLHRPLWGSFFFCCHLERYWFFNREVLDPEYGVMC